MFGLIGRKEVEALKSEITEMRSTLSKLEHLLKDEAVTSGKNKRWTRSEEDMIHKAVCSKTTVNALATLLNRTADAVRTRAIILGYKTQYDLLVEKEDKHNDRND